MLPTSPKKTPNRLWLAISGHGHGHLVQVTPLIRALQARNPELTLLVQSGLPADLLRSTFGDAIEIDEEPVDFGMVMSGPMTVLPAESLAAYRAFHATWDERLAIQIRGFHRFQPDLVIGDIPYLPLAAAKACGIPSVAVCSLNWADIVEHYCAGREGADGIVTAIRSHYAAASLFLRPTPSMPMETLSNTVSIGPLISVGHSRRTELLEVLQLSADQRLALLTLGGIAGHPIDVSRWPPFEHTVFLIPAVWQKHRSYATNSNRFRTIESTGFSYADLFASCDVLITKPGYGAFSGAGCCALPVLFTARGDWPEEDCLIPWLKRIGRAESIDLATLVSGEFSQVLDHLLRRPSKAPVEAHGVIEAVAVIDALLSSNL